MIEIEIDGKKIVASEGSSIIEAADSAQIYIPRFCYHKELSVAANCRMCLVEVGNSKKPLPACATPVTTGMKVFTQSAMARDAQKSVMEFLLVNHPLDCPICDQGGECELQDLSMGYGQDRSRYNQPKRAVCSQNIGPLIETEMTRCIQCTRCVRFGEEVAGMRELGVLERGEQEQIGTYVQEMMRSELSGNVIDLCPVGALTAKPSRYQRRSWEMVEHPAISPHDCVGSHLYHHSSDDIYSPQRLVIRTVPRENAAINQCWASDRDRFSYEGCYSPDRLLEPLVNQKEVHQKEAHQKNQWQPLSWQKILPALSARLAHVLTERGPDGLAGLISPCSTLEEQYLFQKLLRGLGSSHIDHRYREQDFSDDAHRPRSPSLGGLKIADIEKQAAILLVGSYARHEQPLLGHRIHLAAQNGASVMAVNVADYEFQFPLKAQLVVEQLDLVGGLLQVLKAVRLAASNSKEAAALSAPSEEKALLTGVFVSAPAELMATALLASKPGLILLGADAEQHPQAATLRTLVERIAQLTGAKVGFLSNGANSAGAWLAGCVPHRGPGGEVLSTPGLDVQAFFAKPKDIYFIYNVEPELDCIQVAAARRALREAKLVVLFSSYITPQMAEYADYILPITPYVQTEGTYVNVEGEWQTFAAVSVPTGLAKPGWKILRVLANLCHLQGFDYTKTAQIREELLQKQSSVSPAPTVPAPALKQAPQHAEHALYLHTYWPMYRNDALVRRATSLQGCLSAQTARVKLSPQTAQLYALQTGDAVQLQQGEFQVQGIAQVDARIPQGVVQVAATVSEVSGWADGFKPVVLTKGAG